MKRIIALLLVIIMSLGLFTACGKENKLTSENLVGTWHFEKGDLYKLPDDATIRLEVYRGGTAKEFYEGNSHNDFIWEIDENDTEIVNFSMQWMFSSSSATGFTLEVGEDGSLELHSVDGRIILVKVSDTVGE